MVGSNTLSGLDESQAVRYYRLALNAIRTNLQDPRRAHSDEILAACILLSTYEMIDVVGESLDSHLPGVASLLESSGANGDVGGIRGACYWVWYRHETWAALRTGRQMSLNETYWEPAPIDSYEHLRPHDIANRVIFIFGQCVNFCNNDYVSRCQTFEKWNDERVAKAESLEYALSAWKSKLPACMTCYSSESTSVRAGDPSNPFGSTWYIFPQSGIASMVYHASIIILLLHSSSVNIHGRGLSDCTFLFTRSRIESSRREIFSTANSDIADAWALVSTQCLYIAGLVTESMEDRSRTLDLIENCQKKTGRRTGPLADDLRRMWENISIAPGLRLTSL